ncbi:hypothetical protein AB0H71_26855 [Nocardia sp. NPDC050697]|uniref:hypothetical protein n=1 Tax=Nocardia sp. NPDC050697 TaxID=3155158 RepID=UPI0033DF14B5
MFKDAFEKTVVQLLDTGSRLQGPAVAKYVSRLRRAHPDETPAQIIQRLENQYLMAVTGSGGAVGATAAVPGVGTMAALAAVSAETTFFMEASAVYTLAVASVHGITPQAQEQRRALVLAVVLGESGMDIVQKSIGHSAKNWGTAFAKQIPGLHAMNDSLLKRFVLRFITKRAALMAGKVVPAGIGAVIGGLGNRALGKTTIENSRKAFGPAPAHWRDAPLVIDADPLPAIDHGRGQRKSPPARAAGHHPAPTRKPQPPTAR